MIQNLALHYWDLSIIYLFSLRIAESFSTHLCVTWSSGGWLNICLTTMKESWEHLFPMLWSQTSMFTNTVNKIQWFTNGLQKRRATGVSFFSLSFSTLCCYLLFTFLLFFSFYSLLGPVHIFPILSPFFFITSIDNFLSRIVVNIMIFLDHS